MSQENAVHQDNTTNKSVYQRSKDALSVRKKQEAKLLIDAIERRSTTRSDAL